MTGPDNNIGLLLEILDRVAPDKDVPPVALEPAAPIVDAVCVMPIGVKWAIKFLTTTGRCASYRRFADRREALKAATEIADLLGAELVH